MTKGTKNFLNYLLGPLLFIWLSWAIYKQIQAQTDLEQSWQTILLALNGPNNWKIVLVSLLMLVNWGIEARKWQIQVKGIERLSFLNAFKAILAGQAMGFNTINRIGEPIARAAFLKNGNKMRGAVLSIVGSMAQIIVTFAMGTLALIYMRLNILNGDRQLEGLSVFWLDALIYVIGMGILLFSLAYFKLAGLIQVLEKIPFIRKYQFFLEKLEDFHWNELIRLLSLSLVRYFVFLVQYYILLQVFDIHVFWLEAFSLVGVMFLVLGIVPTIALAELGFRGKVSLLLLGLISSNSVGIIATAAGIWLINLILPAIAGTLFILGIRIFRNK
ncbi:lysylphosphatidylglycerol synthase domain-containing protein [Sediminibacterium sp.]|uniref:lysylphosphatidylglycerol synthase domain-containing protein n=1 Tax=Sediminibacterium sp. TaxID=1917865 RepID=UPI0027332150|nr:lysylphosphatidylglycerol synthase domain-containing protein [Sediminibacterium sp.]MDP3567839.1 lysylphosphatidylglycerol synthase domain-containing protein [Sediminibacterium sp.]